MVPLFSSNGRQGGDRGSRLPRRTNKMPGHLLRRCSVLAPSPVAVVVDQFVVVARNETHRYLLDPVIAGRSRWVSLEEGPTIRRFFCPGRGLRPTIGLSFNTLGWFLLARTLPTAAASSSMLFLRSSGAGGRTRFHVQFLQVGKLRRLQTLVETRSAARPTADRSRITPRRPTGRRRELFQSMGSRPCQWKS